MPRETYNLTDTHDVFGRANEDDDIVLLHCEDGDSVRRLDDVDGLYPVDSHFGVKYAHPAGIIITREDAEKFGIVIEDWWKHPSGTTPKTRNEAP